MLAAQAQTLLDPPVHLRQAPAFQESRKFRSRRLAHAQRCSCVQEQRSAASPPPPPPPPPHDWRRRLAAGAAAGLLAAQALLSPFQPPAALAGSSPVLAAGQQAQQAAQPPAALTPDAIAAGLPPLPTSFPPLPPLALPKYKQLTLQNGLRVFLLEVRAPAALCVAAGSHLCDTFQHAFAHWLAPAPMHLHPPDPAPNKRTTSCRWCAAPS